MQTRSPARSVRTFSHRLFRTDLFLPTTCGSVGRFKIHPVRRLFLPIFFCRLSEIHRSSRVRVKSCGTTSMVTGHSGAPFLRNDCPSANAAELMLSLNQIEKRIQIVIQFWVFLCSCMLLSKLVLYGTIKLIQEQHQ